MFIHKCIFIGTWYNSCPQIYTWKNIVSICNRESVWISWSCGALVHLAPVSFLLLLLLFHFHSHCSHLSIPAALPSLTLAESNQFLALEMELSFFFFRFFLITVNIIHAPASLPDLSATLQPQHLLLAALVVVQSPSVSSFDRQVVHIAKPQVHITFHYITLCLALYLSAMDFSSPVCELNLE